MGRKRKKNEEEHESSERWLVSYADFITLLFAFFVTMYAISRVDGKKMGSAVESLQRALGSAISVQMTQRDGGVFLNTQSAAPSVVPVQGGKGHALNAEKETFEKVVKEIKKGVDRLSTGAKDLNGLKLKTDQIKFILEKRGLVIRVSEHLFFDSGHASIRPEFIPMLNVLASAMEGIPNQIRIEGHTDNVPINTSQFPSNWELSTARATTVLRHLLTRFQFSPERLSAVGYAEFRPVDSNDTSETRLQNRRVDFVILSSKEMESEPQGDTGALQDVGSI
jgi:chemotaxis protein MotB